MTIDELYHEKAQGGDMAPNMATLRLYGEICPRIVEFGTRAGCSTVAFLAGGAEVWSYDIAPQQFECPGDIAYRWHFTQADTKLLPDIPECDLLFIDTIHTYFQVQAELRFAPKAKRFIALHDTVIYGKTGDDGSLGINLAIFDFLCANPEWRISFHNNDTWGLTVLEKKP